MLLIDFEKAFDSISWDFSHEVSNKFNYKKNNNGPNIKPCGTPEVTFSQPDLHPDITAL